MFYVYLLKDGVNKLYIGYTSDLKRRLKEHLSGQVYTSRRMNKPELIYYEAYRTERAARVREKKLKQFGSACHGLLKRLKTS